MLLAVLSKKQRGQQPISQSRLHIFHRIQGSLPCSFGFLPSRTDPVDIHPSLNILDILYYIILYYIILYYIILHYIILVFPAHYVLFILLTLMLY